MAILLPTSPTGPQRVNPKVSIFYGAPKVGKTELFNQAESTNFLGKLENVLLADCEEPGSDYITATKIKLRCMEDFLDLHKQVTAIKPRPYKVVAFDTIDKLESWCEDAATKSYKACIIGKSFTGQSVLELPNGAGYNYLRSEFHIMLNRAKQMADHIIFIGHIRDKNIASSTVGAVATIAQDLDLTGKIRNIACAEADAIGYVYRDTPNNGGKICINFQTRDGVNCGSRCEHLKGKDIKPFDWSKIFLPEPTL